MRSGPAKKRKLEADFIYGSALVARFINKVMKAGKKAVAQKLVYQALENIKEKEQDPLQTLERAINTISPRMEVRSRRVGGASYQVPNEVRGDRKIALAIRWIINAAQNRSSKEYKSFDQKLAAEILDASQGLGEAAKKRDQMHKMAEANKAFAHFRW